VAATAASTLSDKPRWEKDIEPLVETAAWNPGKDCRAQPRNGTQFCSGFSDTQTGGLFKVSRFDTGPRRAGT
jgi:hypothetical protein